MSILTEPRVETETETDEPEVAHIVMKRDQMRGYVGGEPIQALCGKVWVPSHDYSGLPVCEECKRIKDRMMKGDQN